MFQSKRKAFDSKQMRVQDNPELVQILKQREKEEKKKGRASLRPRNEDKSAEKSANWKKESNAFREAMRAARDVSTAIATGAPLPPVISSQPDPSLIPCPHCGRRFSQKAGERHIPTCQQIKARPSTLKAHSGSAGPTATPNNKSSNGKSW